MHSSVKGGEGEESVSQGSSESFTAFCHGGDFAVQEQAFGAPLSELFLARSPLGAPGRILIPRIGESACGANPPCVDSLRSIRENLRKHAHVRASQTPETEFRTDGPLPF